MSKSREHSQEGPVGTSERMSVQRARKRSGFINLGIGATLVVAGTVLAEYMGGLDSIAGAIALIGVGFGWGGTEELRGNDSA